MSTRRGVLGGSNDLATDRAACATTTFDQVDHLLHPLGLRRLESNRSVLFSAMLALQQMHLWQLCEKCNRRAPPSCMRPCSCVLQSRSCVLRVMAKAELSPSALIQKCIDPDVQPRIVGVC